MIYRTFPRKVDANMTRLPFSTVMVRAEVHSPSPESQMQPQERRTTRNSCCTENFLENEYGVHLYSLSLS